MWEKMLCMNDETRLRHENYLYAQLKQPAEYACASSQSMVLQPRRVGYMSGEHGDEGLVSGHCHVREAA